MFETTYCFDADMFDDGLKSVFEGKLGEMNITFLNHNEEGMMDDDAGEILYQLNADDKTTLVSFLHWAHYHIDCSPQSFSEEEAEEAIEEV